MIGTRLSIGVRGLTPIQTIEAAARCDEAGLAGFWVNPAGLSTSSDTAGAGGLVLALAAAAATRTVRLGVCLSPLSDLEVLRAAEDIGVVDNASCGRLEIMLVPRTSASRCATGRQLEQVAWRRLLTAWYGWEVDGSLMPVTPRPTQPWLPALVADDGDIAAGLGAGVVVRDGSPPPPAAPLHRRVIVQTAEQIVGALSAGELEESVYGLRTEIARARASEVLLDLSAQEFDVLSPAILSAVVAPGLRAEEAELSLVLQRARAWLDRHPPASGDT